MTDDIATLRRVRRDCRTMAVAGLSADWHRPSYFAARYLQQRRYRIISVNPRYAEVLGERCHPSLADIPHRVDRVDVFRRTEAVLPIAEQAITIGAHCLWQQTGVTNLAAAEQVRSAARVRSAGLDSVLDRVAALEGGRAAFAFACACACACASGSASASGMAAEATALLSLPEAGDHMVAAGTQYGGSVSLPAVNLKKLGTSTTFVDAGSPDALAAAMRPNPRPMFAESLGNPSLRVLDIEAVADVAHAHGVPPIVDNAVASPFLCTPLHFGADSVVHSATKSLAGHGTTWGGVIVEAGTSHPGFAWVVDGAPGASGLLAFGVKPAVAGASAGTAEALFAAMRFINAAQPMSHVANIGDTRTLSIHPASTPHNNSRPACGPTWCACRWASSTSTTSSGTLTRRWRSQALGLRPAAQPNRRRHERALRPRPAEDVGELRCAVTGELRRTQRRSVR